VRYAGSPPPLALPPCRLCFVNAPAESVEACRTRLDVGAAEDPLEDAAREAGFPGETLVAFALLRP